MVNSVRDAFERARKKLLEGAGNAAKADSPASVPDVSVAATTTTDSASSGQRLTQSQKTLQREQARQRVTVTYGRTQPFVDRRGREKPKVSVALPVKKPVMTPPARVPQQTRPAPATPPPPSPPVRVVVSPGAVCALERHDSRTVRLLPHVEIAGRKTQAYAGKTADEREVVLGLDFGTSCVKVVVGDSALGKAFAVPFCKADGIQQFLLPSRLCQTGEVFSLQAGTHVYRDLKLSLLANPDDPVLQRRVVAFLALIIRRARGWLLTEQAATYKRTAIAWKLAVGLPTAQHHQTPLSKLFDRLGGVAWAVASASGEVTESVIKSFLGAAPVLDETADGVEVTVVPEIAAQIYGFVASNSFDKQAPNIYLMADVGSGTVDSSLFRVKPGRGGRWDFEFFTSVVEPNGVSNLHRHRVDWWTEVLDKAKAPRSLVEDLTASKMITDRQLSTPESFSEYFEGVEAKFRESVKSPDQEFFNLRVLAQVQGKTLWRTWKDNLLDQTSLCNIPFFMCGGGVRMGYYQQLEPRLASMPSYTWLKAECWVMGVPDDLVAEGVAEAEYDRLSVAYGLSRLELGKVVKALPQPKLAITPVTNWKDNYVDKDQC